MTFFPRLALTQRPTFHFESFSFIYEIKIYKTQSYANGFSSMSYWLEILSNKEIYTMV